jgi:hypothetical protein
VSKHEGPSAADHHRPQPLSFFSAKLSPAERKYSAFDKELLAAYLVVRHFQFLLEAREFQVLTGHKPLTYSVCAALHLRAMVGQAAKAPLLPGGIYSRHSHVAGKDNLVADALSRPAAVYSDLSSSNSGRPIPGGNMPPSTPHHQTESFPPTGMPGSPGTGLDFKRLAQAQSACLELLEDTLVSAFACYTFPSGGGGYCIVTCPPVL